MLCLLYLFFCVSTCVGVCLGLCVTSACRPSILPGHRSPVSLLWAVPDPVLALADDPRSVRRTDMFAITSRCMMCRHLMSEAAHCVYVISRGDEKSGLHASAPGDTF